MCPDENDIVKLNCSKVMTNCRGRQAETFQVRTESEHDGASPGELRLFRTEELEWSRFRSRRMDFDK